MRERERKIEREKNKQFGWTRFDFTRQVETNLYIYIYERDREREMERERNKQFGLYTFLFF